MAEFLPVMHEGEFGYAFESQQKIMKNTRLFWKQSHTIPPRVNESELLFVSMKYLLDVKPEVPYFRVISKSSASLSILSNEDCIPVKKDRREPCVGFYNGNFGHVFFRNGDYAEQVYADTYLEADDEDRAYIPSLAPGQCIFVSPDRLMEMHFNPYIIVNVNEVQMYSMGDKGHVLKVSSGQTPHPSALTGPKERDRTTTRKAVVFDETPADSIISPASESAGMTTGDSSLSMSTGCNTDVKEAAQDAAETVRAPAPAPAPAPKVTTVAPKAEKKHTKPHGTAESTSSGNGSSGFSHKASSKVVANPSTNRAPAPAPASTSASAAAPKRDAVKGAKISMPRLAGPSNIKEFPMLEVVKKSKEERDAQRAKDTAARCHFSEMKLRFNWMNSWTPRAWNYLDHEVFCVPNVELLSNGFMDGIENLQYFHSVSSLARHLEANPVLTLPWAEQWKMLRKSGWEAVEADEDSGRPQGSMVYRFAAVFSLSETKDQTTPVAGLHYFHSRLAMCHLIQTFPYPLQTDAALKDTLLLHGWKVNSNGEFMNYSRRAVSLAQIRQQAWLDPYYIFSFQKDVTREQIMQAITVPRDIALAEDLEEASAVKPDLPNWDPTTTAKKAPSLAANTFSIKRTKALSGISSDPAEVERELMKAVHEYTYEQLVPGKEGVERRTVPQMKAATRLVKLLNAAGWSVLENTPWAKGEWWRLEKVTLAPWAKPAQGTALTAGLDFFWHLNDIVSYLRDTGSNKRGLIPIVLEVDFGDRRAWDLDRRIQYIARTEANPLENTNLIQLLLETGWSQQKWTKLQNAAGYSINGYTLVPHWTSSTLTGEACWTMENCPSWVPERDFFMRAVDVVRYLAQNGNIPPSHDHTTTKSGRKINDSPLSSSPISSTKSSPLSPESDDRKSTLEFILRSKAAHYIDGKLWGELKQSWGWKNMYTKVSASMIGVPEVVHVPSWTLERLGSMDSKIDLSGLVRKRDYFVSLEEVTAYVKANGPVPIETDPSPPRDVELGKRRRGPVAKSEPEPEEGSTQKVRRTIKGAVKAYRADVARGVPMDVADEDEGSSSEDDVEETEEEEAVWTEKLAAESALSVPDIDIEFEDDYIFLKRMAQRQGFDLGAANGPRIYTQMHAYNKQWNWQFSEIGLTCYSRREEFCGKKLVGPKMDKKHGLVSGRDYWQGLSALVDYIHGQFRARGDSVVALERSAQQMRRKIEKGLLTIDEGWSPNVSSDDGSRPGTDFRLSKLHPYRSCHGRDDKAMEFDTERMVFSGDSPAVRVDPVLKNTLPENTLPENTLPENALPENALPDKKPFIIRPPLGPHSAIATRGRAPTSTPNPNSVPIPIPNSSSAFFRSAGRVPRDEDRSW